MINAAMRMWIVFASTIEIVLPKSLEAGANKDGWVVIQSPTAPNLYTELLDDAKIRPATIGAMWYPAPYNADEHKGKSVVLHFHGGAYVLGGCRPNEGPRGGDYLFTKLDTLVLAPQYRLASLPKGEGRFPAALQDAVTSYRYLLDVGIPAQSIIFSGNSAGGHLALALLRYISGQKQHTLPLPGSVLLWSPWLDLSADWETFREDKKGKTDFLPPELLRWASRVLRPEAVDAKNPYLSPLHAPFAIKVPIFMLAGSAEAFASDIREFRTSMSAIPGNVVKLVEVENAPHDIFAAGELMGWAKEADGVMDVAKRFVEEHQSV